MTVYKSASPYLYQRDGIWDFNKQVPIDVREHHNTARIIKSLHTRNKSQAIRLSTMYLEKLEAYWVSMRMQKMDFLFKSPTTRDGPRRTAPGIITSTFYQHFTCQ